MKIVKGNKARTLLDIMKIIVVGKDNSGKLLQQKIVEKLTEILNIRSCLIFRTFLQKSEKKIYCKITAGVPVWEHKIGLVEELERHPDIEDAVKRKEKYLVIKNPVTDPKCQYFRSTIEQRNIAEILYVSLFVDSDIEGEKRIKGVIVIDKTLHDGREFDEQEIEFFCQVGELLGCQITRDEMIIDEIRDQVLNRLVCIGGLSERLAKLINSILRDGEELKTVLVDLRKLETFFCREDILL